MTIYKNHTIEIIKYYIGNVYAENTVYNELYKCKNCKFSGWNLDLNTIDNDILTCEEWIIKGIIE